MHAMNCPRSNLLAHCSSCHPPVCAFSSTPALGKLRRPFVAAAGTSAAHYAQSSQHCTGQRRCRQPVYCAAAQRPVSSPSQALNETIALDQLIDLLLNAKGPEEVHHCLEARAWLLQLPSLSVS